MSHEEGGIFSGVGILDQPQALFLVQATIILGLCRALGVCGQYLKQPPVIFEVIGGIILGPSVLGKDNKYLTTIFPKASLNYLSIVANIGLTLYLFLIGLELDVGLLRANAYKTGGIALTGMAIPLALGIGISRYMFDTLQSEVSDSKFTSFYVFIGVAMSITAFPVLARMLKEGGLIYTKPGSITMGAAALNDAVAWCLLILAISMANATDTNSAAWAFLTTFGFAILLFFVVNPIFAYIVKRLEETNTKKMHDNLFVFTLMMVFMCAWITELVGVHPIFGAFLFGLIVPRNSRLFKDCISHMETFIVSFTLPLYFALSGLKTDITTITTSQQWAVAVLVIVVATFGKLIGAGGAAYFSGTLTVRECGVVAILMNTRGLIELIVLNLGLSSGILTTRTFSVMVVMCLFTTFLTSPVVEYIYPPSMRVMLKDFPEKEEDDEHSVGDDKVLVQRRAESMKIDVDVESAEDNAEPGLVGLVAFTRTVRLGVVIGKLESMEHVLKLLSYFTPSTPQSDLSVTAMHFAEPTYDEDDELIPVDAEGRVIRIDEDATDFYSIMMSVNEDRSEQRLKIFSLAMFCNTIGSAVNSFRIKGNPKEYADEVEILSEGNDCSLLVMPWNENIQYLRKLFLSIVHVASAPIILAIDSRDSSGSKLLHAAHDKEAVIETRERSGTFFNYLARTLNTESNVPSPPQAGSEVDHPVDTDNRNRTDSTVSADDVSGRRQSGIMLFSQIYAKMSSSEAIPEPVAKYSNVDASVAESSRSHRGVVITNDLKSTKMQAATRPVVKVVGIVTGKSSDIVVLSILLRISESTFSEVTLILPPTWQVSMAAEISNAIIDFKESTKDRKNVEVHDAASSEADNLCADVNFLSTSLFICSYVSMLSDAAINFPSHDVHSGSHIPELGIVGNVVYGDPRNRHVEIFIVHPSRKVQDAQSLKKPAHTRRASLAPGF